MFFAALSLSVVLTDENMSTFLESSSKPVFLKAWATWCPHCKKLAPIWDEISSQGKFVDQVIFADIECEENRKSCKKLEGENYPRLYWIDNKNNTNFRYTGERSLDSFNLFIQKQLQFPLIPVDESDINKYIETEGKTSTFLFTIDENENEKLKIAKIACSNQRASAAQFLLLSKPGETSIKCFSGDDFIFYFTESWDVDSITNFIKLHTVKSLAKVDGYILRYSDDNKIPVFITILNSSDTVPEQSRNYARVASNYVMTGYTNCYDNAWFCRYLSLFGTDSNPKYVLYSRYQKNFWVYDENDTVDNFIADVKRNKIKAQGPGTGILSVFKKPFYDAKEDGRPPPYGLFLIPVMFVILVIYALHDMRDKAFKVD